MNQKKYFMFHLPPLVKANVSIIVQVHVAEKIVELSLRHRQPRSLESRLELRLVQLPVAVTIDGFEEVEELALCLPYKNSKL